MAITGILLLLLYACLIGYYLLAWRRAPTFTAQAEPLCRISVVIALRNEAHNVPALFSALSRQTYPQNLVEILLIDDFSTDDTAARVEAAKPSNAKLIAAEGDAATSSKKKAITKGIRQASGELIVTTDADCTFTPDWLADIHAFYQSHQSCFIAAPVRYNYQDSWVERLQALDFLILQGITAAAVSSRFHYMCNGANLAYPRPVFNAVNGFEGVDHLASGDDMFLMQKVASQYPGQVHYLKSKEAIVTTRPMPTWNALLQQRRRWASKTFAYTDPKLIAILGFVFFFNAWFLVLLAAGFFQPVFFFMHLDS